MIRNLDKRSPFLMIAPMLVIIVLFLGFLVYVLGLSVTASTLAKPFNEFVGFANYAAALKDKIFGNSIQLTLLFAFFVTIIETILGFIFAMILHAELKAQRFLRSLALLPLFTPPVAVGMIWKLIYDPSSGFINHYLKNWGIITQPIAFLGDSTWSMPAIVFADIWQWTPFCFLLILAAFQSLPYEPYEAAAVDGASGWQTFRRLTLPLVLPSVIITFLFRLLTAMKVFDLVYMLTFGGPGTSTQVASFYIFKVAFKTFKTGYGAALTFLVFLLISVIATLLTMGRTAFMKGKE
ncbi:MAG TPA: sugar ABC transporter permease [Anaerolineales bacterium]|nr:sugar ABC transporter permease [Anaerolineales bacterium]